MKEKPTIYELLESIKKSRDEELAAHREHPFLRMSEIRVRSKRYAIVFSWSIISMIVLAVALAACAHFFDLLAFWLIVTAAILLCSVGTVCLVRRLHRWLGVACPYCGGDISRVELKLMPPDADDDGRCSSCLRVVIDLRE